MKHPFESYILINVFYIFSGNICDRDVNGIQPEEYKLIIEPYFNNFTFWGKVSITFSIVNATNQFLVSAEQIKQESIDLTHSDDSESLGINVGFMENNGTWLIFSVEELIGRFTLNISFTGYLNNIKEEEGFFYNIYIDNETDKIYAATESRTSKASRLFPRFDNPFTKTPFTAQIARDPLHATLSSMQLQETSLQGAALENQVWDTFYSPNISIYQVGFIIHELSSAGNVNFTVLAKAEALDQTNLSLSLLSAIAEEMQEWFRDQPIVKLAVVTLPDGGPEMIFYPGLVFCREDQILFKEKISNSKSRQKIKENLVHILFKQLLSKVVIEDGGFSEGIVSYLEQKLLSQLDPASHISRPFFPDIIQAEIVNNYKESTHIFHKKVAGVLRMIADDISIGETVVKAVLQLLSESEPVTAEKLLSNIGQLVGDSSNPNNLTFNYTPSTIMYAWTSQPGWPIVTVTMNRNGSTISINQMSSTDTNTTWPILLRFKTDRDFDSIVTDSHQTWLTESFHEIKLDSSCKWVLVTNGESDLFRVNYDLFGWRILADELLENHPSISADARSQLVDDIFHLAERGLVNYTEVFHLTQYLSNEMDYLPWQSAASNFEKLIRLFHGTQLAFDLQDYVKTLYSPYFEEVYRITSLNVSHTERLISSDALFWGCHWGLKSCLQFTSELFKQWLSVSTRFPPDYKQAALCTGVKEFPDVFLEVFDAYTQSAVEGDRQVFLRALTCTKNTSHINFLLELVFLDESQMLIGHHSKLLLIQYTVETPENVGTVITFLGNNYDAAMRVVGIKAMSAVWSFMERNIYAQEDILLIQNMTENTSLPISMRESLNSILATVRATQNKASKLAPLVTSALSQHWPVSSSAVRTLPRFNVSFPLQIILLFNMCWIFKFNHDLFNF